MKATYLKLDFDDIQLKFPLSVSDIISWFASKEDIIQGLIGMGGDIATKEEVILALKQVVPVIIQHDPRKLYEFFDEKNIKIYIGNLPGEENVFVYHNSRDKHSLPADTRIEAEGKAFMDAFSILEKELINDKDSKKSES